MGNKERYGIAKKIADGGMAEVFVATQSGEEGFARTVVLKRILPAFSTSPQFRNMLVDEAHIVMTLHHANIVPVMDLGQKDGSYFLVMELVDGWDLATILARASKAKLPLPVGLALHLTAEVCRGLFYAHTRRRQDGKPMSIVHRDISPQNVLVSEQGEVRVTDFGIAKALGKRTRTETGVVKGNADFMSPEQASGAPLDATSDIFSVGAMLYLLCTGERPFTGPTDLDTFHKVQKGEYTPPEERSRLVTPAVAAIVKKAMQVSLSLRYRSAKEMMLELEAVLRRDFRAAGQSELVQWLAELGQRDGELPASRRAGLPYEATKVLGVEDLIAVDDVPSTADRDQPSISEATADEPSIVPPPPAAREPQVPRSSRRSLRAFVGVAVVVACVAAVAVTTRPRRGAVPRSLATEVSPQAPLPSDKAQLPAAAGTASPSSNSSPRVEARPSVASKKSGVSSRPKIGPARKHAGPRAKPRATSRSSAQSPR